MSECPTRGPNGSIDCTAAMQQLFDYLDGELTEDRMRQVRTHLEMCQRCYPHYDFEKAFLEALAATRKRCCAPGKLRERILSELRAAGFSLR